MAVGLAGQPRATLCGQVGCRQGDGDPEPRHHQPASPDGDCDASAHGTDNEPPGTRRVFDQVRVGIAIVDNTDGNALLGLSPSNVRCLKRVVAFSFNEGPYTPNRCALMSSGRWRTGSQVRVGTTCDIFWRSHGRGHFRLRPSSSEPNTRRWHATFTRSKKS